MGEQMSTCCNQKIGSSHEIQINSFDKDLLNLPFGAFRPSQTHININEGYLQTLTKALSFRNKLKDIQNSQTPDHLFVMDVKVDSGKTEQVYCRGQIQNEEIDGEVTLHFPRGEIFKGLIAQRHPVYGSFVFKKGCFYTGDISNYNAEGQGRYQNFDTGYTYEGNWSKSLPHGTGKQTYRNGDTYEGEVMYGQKFGQGTYRFVDGKVYQGSFYYNQSDGRGTMSYPNDNFFEGEWKLGKFHGRGKFVWKNGETYEGEYIDGVRQGQGKYTFRNGSWYQGSWEKGMQSGRGVFHEGYDDVEGQWIEGNLVG